MRIKRSRMWDQGGPHAPFRFVPEVRESRWHFGQFSLGISPPFDAGPRAGGIDLSDFIEFGHREGLHVAHQGVLHANVVTFLMWHVKECRMKLTFSFYGGWDIDQNLDKCQQQVRLAVLVARIRGTVRSGVCAC